MARDSFRTTGDDSGGGNRDSGGLNIRESLQKRAMKRTVWETDDPREWLVEGDGRLGDEYPEYQVTLPEGERAYDCSCYRNLGGDSRRRSMCSHVTAVVMCRRGLKEYAGNVEGVMKEKAGWADDDPRWGDLPGTMTTMNGSRVEPGDGTAESADNTQANLEESDLDGGNAHLPAQHASDGYDREALRKTLRSRSRSARVSPSPEKGPTEEGGGGGGSSPGEPTPATPTSSNIIPFPRTYDPTVSLAPDLDYLPMPPQFKGWREGQEEVIEEIVQHYANGVKVVFVDAPTGTGKTWIGEGVRRAWAKEASTSVYACTTKTLQDQVREDFDYSRVIKGRANYKPIGHPHLTCEDCDGKMSEGMDSCSWCPDMRDCPYYVAKEEAAAAHLPVLNVAYFLNETMSAGSRFRGRSLVLLDEGDTIEDQLKSFFEVAVGPKMRAKVGVRTMPKLTVKEDWPRWIEEEMHPATVEHIKHLTSQTSLFGRSIEERRELRRLQRMRDDLTMLQTTMTMNDASWVLTGYEDDKRAGKSPTLVFKPVRVNQFARRVLWDQADRFLVMSATLISAAQVAEETGLEDGEWAVVELRSPFPVENRPIIYDPAVAMSNKNKDTAYPVMTKAVQKVIDDNPGVRILVHTVSYHLARHLYQNLTSSRVMTYWDASQRDRALEDYTKRRDAVMLAPSFERGVNLADELCEVIVIPKIAYPNLGDKQVSERFYGRGGQTWFAVETIRTIVQQTGRGVRHKDDVCDTYILDGAFSRLYRENKTLFPAWWREALALGRNDPKYRPLIRAAEERRDQRQAKARMISREESEDIDAGDEPSADDIAAF